MEDNIQNKKQGKGVVVLFIIAQIVISYIGQFVAGFGAKDSLMHPYIITSIAIGGIIILISLKKIFKLRKDNPLFFIALLFIEIFIEILLIKLAILH